MADDARMVRDLGIERQLAAATITAYEILQTPTGRAGVHDSPVAVSSGNYFDLRTIGQATATKATGFVALKGGRAYWDHSANNVTYKKANDRDFYVGRFAEDSSLTSLSCVVDLNSDPPYDLDIARDPFVSSNTCGATYQVATRAKVGATAGWAVAAADNLPYVATLPASQTGSTLIIPINGLRIGDVITGFAVNAQIESAGGAVTIDGDLRAVTNVAAEPTDASIATMTQVSVTADTASAQAKTGVSETVTAGKSYYLKITATTAAATDIILQHPEVMVQRSLYEGCLNRRGGAHNIVINASNQAQKVDMLSYDGFATGANAIIRLIFNVISDGAGTVVDASLGIANATHATDADSITDSIFVHLNANDVNIYLESDDGTTEVAATDSTIDYTEGTPVEVWFDMRNPADVQIYINGVLALDGTTFNVNASAATWKLLAHVEKTAATDTYEINVNAMQAWFAEQ